MMIVCPIRHVCPPYTERPGYHRIYRFAPYGTQGFIPAETGDDGIATVLINSFFAVMPTCQRGHAPHSYGGGLCRSMPI